MTATVTVLRYGPERNGRLAYPEGYDACLRVRDIYAKQRREIRPFFHFVAATPEGVSQETAQMISDADSIVTVNCVNNYALDNYIRDKEESIAEIVEKDNTLRRLGGEAGNRLYRFIDDALNGLEDGQHGLVIVDGFDLTFWARKITKLQALRVYDALTGYKSTRIASQKKVLYQGVSLLDTTSQELPVHHSPLPQTAPWVQARANGTMGLDDSVITLDLEDKVHEE